jgi:hypothetical protein
MHGKNYPTYGNLEQKIAKLLNKIFFVNYKFKVPTTLCILNNAESPNHCKIVNHLEPVL